MTRYKILTTASINVNTFAIVNQDVSLGTMIINGFCENAPLDFGNNINT